MGEKRSTPDSRTARSLPRSRAVSWGAILLGTFVLLLAFFKERRSGREGEVLSGPEAAHSAIQPRAPLELPEASKIEVAKDPTPLGADHERTPLARGETIPEGELALFFHDPAGRPVPGIRAGWIRRASDEELGHWQESGEDGVIHWDQLAAGEYRWVLDGPYSAGLKPRGADGFSAATLEGQRLSGMFVVQPREPLRFEIEVNCGGTVIGRLPIRRRQGTAKIQVRKIQPIDSASSPSAPRWRNEASDEIHRETQRVVDEVEFLRVEWILRKDGSFVVSGLPNEPLVFEAYWHDESFNWYFYREELTPYPSSLLDLGPLRVASGFEVRLVVNMKDELPKERLSGGVNLPRFAGLRLRGEFDSLIFAPFGQEFRLFGPLGRNPSSPPLSIAAGENLDWPSSFGEEQLTYRNFEPVELTPQAGDYRVHRLDFAVSLSSKSSDSSSGASDSLR